MRSTSRGSRGAIMVEALLVTPLMIVLWMVTLNLFSVGWSSIEVNREVREPVWEASVSVDCAGFGAPVTAEMGLDSNDAFMQMRKIVTGILGFLGGSLLDEGMGRSVFAKRTRNVAGLLMNWVNEVRAADSMACPLPTGEFDYSDLFGRICGMFGGKWCPL
jgi:hypothetical protein